MARLSFRGGIVEHQTDTQGNPTFLDVTGGSVNLVVSPDPTIITVIDGNTDYLFTESVTVPNAWGPFVSGPNYWLYWDINPVSGIRTFGSTTLPPIQQASAPKTPVVGQMWFNTRTNEWNEWGGSAWSRVIRTFACRLDASLTPRSVSVRTPQFVGTQVGFSGGNFQAGAITFDAFGKPIRRSDGKFFTTEDQFLSGVPSGIALRISNILLPGQAQEHIPAFHVVEFDDFHEIKIATPFSVGVKLLGIIEEDAVTNEVVNFVTEGIIFNEQWNWEALGANANDPVYFSSTGEIQLTQEIPNQIPVGVVIDRHTIIFFPKLFPQVIIGQETLQAVVAGKVDRAGDTMTGFLTLNSDPTSNLHAASKQYVDNSGLVDNQTIERTLGNVLSVKQFDSGGIVDAKFWQNLVPSDLDAVYAPIGHDHPLPYDIAFFIGGPAGTPSDRTVGVFVATRTITITGDAPNLEGYALTPPASDVTYRVVKNGDIANPVATITFPAGSNTPSSTTLDSSTITLSSSDRFQLITPAIAETTIEDVSITIVGCANSGNCPQPVGSP